MNGAGAMVAWEVGFLETNQNPLLSWIEEKIKNFVSEIGRHDENVRQIVFDELFSKFIALWQRWAVDGMAGLREH